MPTTEKTKSLGLWAVSASVLCLALAIVYFAWEAQQWRKALPRFLVQTEKAAAEISRATENVTAIGKLVPPILDEVGKSRTVVEKTAEQVKLTREQLPDLIGRIEPITRQIQTTTEKLPAALAPVLVEVRKTRALVPDVLKTVRNTNITVNKAADEVARTREAMPGFLDRADKIVQAAGKAGEEAGQGAVTGLLGGIITMPIKVVGSLGKAAVGLIEDGKQAMLTEKDIELIDARIMALTNTGTTGQAARWDNKASGNSGTITLQDRYESRGQACAQFKVAITLKDKETQTSLIKGCRQPDGTWQATEGALPGKGQ